MLSTPQALLIASLRFYRLHFWLFVGYTTWLLVPSMALILITQAPRNTFFFALTITMTAVEVVLSLWIYISIMRSSVLLKNNQALDSTQLSLEAWRAVGPVLIVALLQILIIFGGMILLIIPGIVFCIWFAFSQQAVVIDKKA